MASSDRQPLRPVGLLLLTDDIRNGQHLIFRYPATCLSLHPRATSKPKKVETPPTSAVMGQYISSDTFAKLFRPRSNLCGQTLEVVIDSVRHICHPTEVKFDDADREAGVDPCSLIFFNVVFELAPMNAGSTVSRGTKQRLEEEDSSSGVGGGGVSIDLVKRVAANLAAALLHEEHRCRYVSNETKKMVSIRDDYKMNGRAGGGGDRRGSSGSNSSSSGGCGHRRIGSDEDSGLGSRRSSYDTSFSKQQQQQQDKSAVGGINSLGNLPPAGSMSTQTGSISFGGAAAGSGTNNLTTNSSISTTAGAGMADSSNGATSSSVTTNGTPPRSIHKRSLQLPSQPQKQQQKQSQRDRWGDDDVGGEDGDDDPRLVEALVEASQLARDLRNMFYGLKNGLGDVVMVNSWVNVSFRVRQFRELGARDIKPYHTLLLVEDEAQVLASLPTDASPQLRQLVMTANPMRSLQEIALEMELSLQQVFRLAAHMAYWGHGRVIDTIASSNVYCVASDGCDISLNNPLCAEFSRKFPRRTYSLQQILASFCSGQSLKDIMAAMNKSHHLTLIHMLVWLLQHRFLKIMHQYVYLVLPASTRSPSVGPYGRSDYYSSLLQDGGAPTSPASTASQNSKDNVLKLDDVRAASNTADGNSEMTDTRDMANTSGSGGSVIGNGGGNAVMSTSLSHQTQEDAVERENRRVNAFLDSLNDASPAYTLFRRLCPYFRKGKMHLREIIWAEQLDGGQVMEVLQMYSEVLVVSLRAEE